MRLLKLHPCIIQCLDVSNRMHMEFAATLDGLRSLDFEGHEGGNQRARDTAAVAQRDDMEVNSLISFLLEGFEELCMLGLFFDDFGSE